MLPWGPVSCFVKIVKQKSLCDGISRISATKCSHYSALCSKTQHIMSVEAKSQIRMDPPESGRTYVYKTINACIMVGLHSLNHRTGYKEATTHLPACSTIPTGFQFLQYLQHLCFPCWNNNFISSINVLH